MHCRTSDMNPPADLDLHWMRAAMVEGEYLAPRRRWGGDTVAPPAP